MSRAATALALVLAPALAGAAPDVRMLEGRISALEQRVAQGSGTTAGGGFGQVELVTQFQQLQEEVRNLRGQVEQSANTVEQLQKRQRELYLDLDRRLAALEGSGGAGPAPSPAEAGDVPAGADPAAMPADAGAPGGPSGAASAAPGGSRPASPSAPAVAPPGTPAANAPAGTAPPAGADEQTLYRTAYEDLRAARYEAAIAGFRNMLNAYPQGDLADNAQYWIGECYYVTRQYDQAVTEFAKVVSGYPQSPKAADAELKIGFVHYNQRRFAEARQHLNNVVTGWPTTPAARLAQSHLRRMQEEGV